MTVANLEKAVEALKTAYLEISTAIANEKNEETLREFQGHQQRLAQMTGDLTMHVAKEQQKKQ